MRYLILLSLCLLFTHSILKSQALPIALLEDFGIQDVFMKNGETYYSSITDIMKIDQENNKVIIDDRSLSSACLEGKFYELPNGWIYLGWKYIEIDLLLPVLLIRKYTDEVLTNHSMSFLGNLNELAGEFQAVTFQSMDSIYILNGWNDFQLLTVNIKGEIIESVELNLSQLNDMILLEDDLNLIVGKDDLYTFGSGEIQKEIAFNHEIEDVKHFSNDRIEVLTEENIYWLNHNLNILKTIALPQNSRTPKALYTSNNITHLIEVENNQSYISAMDSNGNILSEFIEIPNVKYQDIKVFDNKFAIWGRNDCALSDNILKLDIDGVDYEIPTTDIGIEELTVKHDSTTTDTIFNNGDPIFFTKAHFSWDMTVTNNSTETIDQYYVNSSPIGFGAPPFIKFTEQQPLLSFESRIHSGTFSNNKFNSQPIGFYTWIGTDILDSDCSDNSSWSLAITTSIYENKKMDVVLYPNPTTEEVTIDYPNKFSFKIIDSSGNLKMVQNNYQQQTIDISHLASGMYFIELNSVDFNLVKKVVKF